MRERFGYKIYRKSMDGEELVDNKIAGAHGFFNLESAIAAAKSAAENIVIYDTTLRLFSLVCIPYQYEPTNENFDVFAVTPQPSIIVYTGTFDKNPNNIPNVFRQKSILSEKCILVSNQYFL